jgi:hypothetical protein
MNAGRLTQLLARPLAPATLLAASVTGLGAGRRGGRLGQ